jgi:hypothetical protein
MDSIIKEPVETMQLPQQVLKSAAGYYIGTFHPTEGPVSRDSCEYWPRENEAVAAFRSGNWTSRD